MTTEHREARRTARYSSLIGVAVATTVAAGFVHGRLTQRWGPVPDLLAAGAHLSTLPAQIGDWQLVSDEPIDERTLQMLSCAGHVKRQYVNRKTGETIWVAILVGPSGPIAVHTPEICYSSRATTIEGERAPVSLVDAEGRSNTFWSLWFATSNPSADRLRVWYGWSGSGVWKASESPRFEYAAQPLLFKLQIASFVPSAERENPSDPCQGFLSALLQSGWNVNG
jgi:hypothetical protein